MDYMTSGYDSGDRLEAVTYVSFQKRCATRVSHRNTGKVTHSRSPTRREDLWRNLRMVFVTSWPQPSRSPPTRPCARSPTR